MSELVPLPELVSIDAPPPSGVIHPIGSEGYLDQWRAQIDLRVEVIARAVIQGKLSGPRRSRNIQRIAKGLKVSPKAVKLWITDPQVLKKAAVYAVSMALPHQAERAKEDIQAFKAVANIAGLIESGPRQQVNVAIDNRARGDTAANAKWFEQYQQRITRPRDVQDIEQD